MPSPLSAYRFPLTALQQERYASFEGFTAAEVTPHAAAWDRAQAVPASALAALGREGYLGANIPAEFGGKGWDAVTFGLLHEAIGRGDSALADHLTVQAMVSSVLIKWGTPGQRTRWLKPLATGEALAAFALTEPGCGSDLNAMATLLGGNPGGGYVLDGEKKWISAAQSADIFLVFAKLEQRPVACLVPRSAPGVEIEPIRDLMGFRAAGLASVRFRDVAVPAADLVGKPGFAFTHIAPHGLHFGRISTACSSLGLLRACVEESASWAGTRRSGGQRIGDLGLIQGLVARMGTNLAAAQGLCWNACRATDDSNPDAFQEVMTAKYFTSQAAAQAASDAVQIHGASGCHESAPVARYYRNAKIMEIIEGTTQVHEALLGKSLIDAMGSRPRAEANRGAMECKKE